MIADILARILEWKHQEVMASRRQVPLDDLQRQVRDLPPSRVVLAGAGQRSGARHAYYCRDQESLAIGRLDPEDFDPVSIATTYANHGAAAISVLTDHKFFQGELAFLETVRQHVEVPLLRKDFVVDAYQLYEARVHELMLRYSLRLR